VSRGKIKALVVLAAASVAAFYAWRDMNLPLKKRLAELPDIVVENLEFRRTVNGRDLHLVAAAAEHNSSLIKAAGIVISVREPDSARSAIMRAASGEFAQEGNSLNIRSLDGSVFLGNRSMDVAAPSASYEVSADIWSFEEGVELWDADAFIKGGAATITSNGVLSLRKGAYARWTTQ
jgi:hypothetical protein